jgi:hypothetical protein
MGAHTIIYPNDKTTMKTLPTKFCWTKMGDEAGQGLNGIIARKDTERALGNGIFYWGIGTALGQRIWAFIKAIQNPVVLFSPMKTRAKLIDTNPDRIFAWTAYIDRRGVKHSIPRHALITSRGTAGGKVKSSHYALVCHKHTAFSNESWPSLNPASLRNFDSGSRLGFSQVTTIVESKNHKPIKDSSYHILFGADLVEPFYVTLVDPVEIPKRTWVAANELWASNQCDIDDWKLWLRVQSPRFRKVYFAANNHPNSFQCSNTALTQRLYA